MDEMHGQISGTNALFNHFSLMKFVIITHVVHKQIKNNYFGYSPYIREMNRWLKYVGAVKIVAPLDIDYASRITATYHHDQLEFERVSQISLLSILDVLKTFFKLPVICFKIWKSMRWADHIHLRCPGNLGLLGSVIQVFFPSKTKTVKYAGNWDPNSDQPWSYKLQKWILSNTFLSKNIKVLVYGEWAGQTKNILPFFTASFSEKDIEFIDKDFSNNLNFLFVGSLMEGKQPIYAIRLVEELKASGKNVCLKIFGEGPLQSDLENYIELKQELKRAKVETWGELHEELFGAMKFERVGTLAVLSLIIVVACFNLVTTLVLLTAQKAREFGILQVLGSNQRAIKSIIMYQGVLISSLGIISGLILGLFIIFFQNIFGFIPLPEDIYFTSHLPMVIQIKDIIAILIISFGMVITSIYISVKRTIILSSIKSIFLDK